MGYFANLYVVQINADEGAITLRTCVYAKDVGARAYFSWEPGNRPAGMHSYADGTIYSDAVLELLPGYPIENIVELDGNWAVIDANFAPYLDDAPVLFHFVLPERFLPRRDMKPLEQPAPPCVSTTNDRVVVTYATAGRQRIRFCIMRLADKEKLADYEQHKMLHPDESQFKYDAELSLGMLKIGARQK